MERSKYNPISCDDYDQLTLMSMKGSWLEIVLKNDIKTFLKIEDITTENGSEFLISSVKEKIRLDDIVTIRELNPQVETRAHTLRSLDYNRWANDRIISHLFTLETAPDECDKFMSHIFNALDIWISRLQNRSHTYGVWELHPKSTWVELNDALHKKSIRLSTSLSLDKVVHYKDTRGNSGSKLVGHILHHMVNHSTYHRGQINLLLNQSGIKGISTDLIWYK